MRLFHGFWGAGEKAYFIFREQEEITIILREPGSKLLILGSWGALSKMYCDVTNVMNGSPSCIMTVNTA